MEPVGYFREEFLPISQISWPLDDLGPMVGAIAVERLRTFGGRFIGAERHFERLMTTCRGLNIDWPWDEKRFLAILDELRRDDGDWSYVVLGSPGRRGTRQPTVMIYPEALPVERLRNAYGRGMTLASTPVFAIPEACWPPAWKVRSRLNYHLADQAAVAATSDPFAIGWLSLFPSESTAEVSLGDTSLASAVIVSGGVATTPPQEDVLPSVTLARYTDWLRTNHKLHLSSVTASQAAAADEILLLGSTGQVHAANSYSVVDRLGKVVSRRELPGTDGPVYRRLLEHAIEQLQFDFTQV